MRDYVASSEAFANVVGSYLKSIRQVVQPNSSLSLTTFARFLITSCNVIVTQVTEVRTSAQCEAVESRLGSERIGDSLRIYSRLMRRYPVNARVNRVANDDEECSAPAELGQIQNRLFT